jgi:hypothetical protein
MLGRQSQCKRPHQHTSFSNVSLIALSRASYEVGTIAPASLSASFLAWADSSSPPLFAPCYVPEKKTLDGKYTIF